LLSPRSASAPCAGLPVPQMRRPGSRIGRPEILLGRRIMNRVGTANAGSCARTVTGNSSAFIGPELKSVVNIKDFRLLVNALWNIFRAEAAHDATGLMQLEPPYAIAGACRNFLTAN
jgi:hypothetical protein